MISHPLSLLGYNVCNDFISIYHSHCGYKVMGKGYNVSMVTSCTCNQYIIDKYCNGMQYSSWVLVFVLLIVEKLFTFTFDEFLDKVLHFLSYPYSSDQYEGAKLFPSPITFLEFPIPYLFQSISSCHSLWLQCFQCCKLHTIVIVFTTTMGTA